jgi:hypothetical protein
MKRVTLELGGKSGGAAIDYQSAATGPWKCAGILHLVPIHGSSLARLGARAELASGSDYAGSQLWSRALWEHSDQPDGILYRSCHDDSALCVAVFDRAKNGLAIVQDHSLAEDSQQLARLLRRYGLGLTN